MSEWISVKDKLPKDGEYVIFSRCNGCGEMGQWRLEGYHPGLGPRFVGARFNYPAGEEYGDVTHWMPMPASPNE